MTIATHNAITITIPNMSTVREIYCVYEHYMQTNPDTAQPPELIFVATCKLTDVFHAREAWNNSDWLKLIAHKRPVLVRIIATGDDAHECKNYAMKYIRSLSQFPRCNLRGYNVAGAAKTLISSDGRTFTNQSEAAIALGVSPGAISQHLAGKIKMIKGIMLAYQGISE